MEAIENVAAFLVFPIFIVVGLLGLVLLAGLPGAIAVLMFSGPFKKRENNFLMWFGVMMAVGTLMAVWDKM